MAWLLVWILPIIPLPGGCGLQAMQSRMQARKNGCKLNKIVVGGAALIFAVMVSACSEDGDAGMFPIELADSRVEAV